MSLREIEPSAMDAGGRASVARGQLINAPDPIAPPDDQAGQGIARTTGANQFTSGDPTPSEPAVYDVPPKRAPRARGAALQKRETLTMCGGSTSFDRPNVVANPAHLLAGHDGGHPGSASLSSVAAVTPFDRSTELVTPINASTDPDGGHPGNDTPSTSAAVDLSDPANGAPKLKTAVRSRGGGRRSTAVHSDRAPAKKSRPAVHAANTELCLPDGGDGHATPGHQARYAVANLCDPTIQDVVHKQVMSDYGGGLVVAGHQPYSAVATIVDLWRQRVDLKRAAQRLNLQALAVCRRANDGDKEAAQKVWGAVQKGRGPNDLSIVVEPYRQATALLEDNANKLEKQLSKLVRTHPLWTWANDVRGLGEVSIAGLIGEASGNPGDYKSVSALWKRFGLAVIEGGRQRKVTDAAQALLHGYAPQRRAFAYVVSCNLMKSQKAGDRYRSVYDRRKAYELERGIPKAHAHNRALRVMVKELMKDAWAADRRLRNRTEIAA